jgi:hypothetical protein
MSGSTSLLFNQQQQQPTNLLGLQQQPQPYWTSLAPQQAPQAPQYGGGSPLHWNGSQWVTGDQPQAAPQQGSGVTDILGHNVLTQSQMTPYGVGIGGATGWGGPRATSDPSDPFGLQAWALQSALNAQGGGGGGGQGGEGGYGGNVGGTSSGDRGPPGGSGNAATDAAASAQAGAAAEEEQAMGGMY